ncbi:SAF domain-containing protein [Candidatus Methylomirabilis sp.]|uniref:SAF domain-containing protein n=1 Tax=Candidatus Methylomirabilis sp. TaxID=2032687 RepID=UPI002A61B4D8|nr:hypothetical protein [Candidatus Methylomirabilis sp.]
MPVGTRLERKHLAAKKPGTGIPADQIDLVVGCRLVTEVRRGRMLKTEDLCSAEEDD